MISNNYSNRLFGRTRGRSKKKIDLKKYYQTVDKYKFQNCDKKINYILDIGTGYGETSIFLANQFLDKVIISCEKYIDGNISLLKNIKNLKPKLNQDIKFIANFGREIEYYTGIVFEVFSGKKEIARGGRYDDLLKSLGAKKNIPAVGAAINLKNI